LTVWCRWGVAKKDTERRRKGQSHNHTGGGGDFNGGQLA